VTSSGGAASDPPCRRLSASPGGSDLAAAVSTGRPRPPPGPGTTSRHGRLLTSSYCRHVALQARAELAFWRWRAGLETPPLPDPEHPYALQILGAWARASERWSAIGCSYEAALALAHAGNAEPLKRALEELEAIGAVAAADRVSRVGKRSP
jgi:hypothetical protein